VPRRTLRRSQLVGTFGPGAIADLPFDSVMVCGIDAWPDDAPTIQEPRLEKYLRVKSFRLPPASGQGQQPIPVVRFPRYLVCPKCNRLHDLDKDLFPEQGKVRCSVCGATMHPSRFLIACTNGHISDFPWMWWVHGDKPCSAPSMKVYSMGVTSSLGDIIVRCECGKHRPMTGVFGQDALKGFKCPGRRPWLIGDDGEDCDQVPRVLQRGASNVYFAYHESALSIPEWSSRVQAWISQRWDTLHAIPDSALEQTLKGMAAAVALNVEVRDILAAIRRRKDHLMDESRPSREKLRYDEARALRQGSTETQPGDFECVPEDVHEVLQPLVNRVMLVKRVKEVRALRGFTRIAPPGEDVPVAPISRTPTDWLPAVEIRGEGIYLELDEKCVRNWEGTDAVRRRVSLLDSRYREVMAESNRRPERTITPRFVLLHTLAHLLITQLALDCGYSQSSLRERIYSITEEEARNNRFEPFAGILIYTATPDSDGSLGGLVRQGMTERFAALLQDTIQGAAWCSSDPLCIESTAQGYLALNMAACHACCLVPETSCEYGNRFLDRALVVGYEVDGVPGYFKGLR